MAKEAVGRRWKTWQLLVGAGVAFLFGIGVGAVSPDEGQRVAATGEATTTRPTLSHVQVIPPPSSPAPTPPPTLATTTTRPATTTTTRPSRDAQLVAFAQAFERTRVGLADAIKKDNPGSVSSVDRFEYDPTGPTVILSVTSDYRTAQYLQDSAWAVTKSMQPLWEAKTIANLPDVIPRFRLTVGTVRYNCPHDFMVRLAELRASREDWEATCRA